MLKLSVMEASPASVLEEIRLEIAHLLLPGLSALGVLIIWVADAARWPWATMLLGLILLLASLMALLLLGRSYSAAIGLVLLGCLMACLLAVHWFPADVPLALLALPVGLAALLLNAQSSLAMATLATASILWGGAFFHGGARPATLVIIWGVEALMWAAAYFGGQAMILLWSGYQRMHQLLEDMREQRLELKQTQDDLVQANNELARLSERLAWMNQIAQEARQAKEQFVANVSHELRTPLNMIIGFVQVISETPDAYGIDLPPALLADIEVILRNSKHLASLVDDVLDLSQAEAQRMSLNKERASLQDICREAVVAVRPLFEARGLYLELDVQDGLPSLFCDRTRIRQVLLNLASNAGRFTECGGVRIGARKEGPCVVVAVADTGPGIAPEHQQRIFEPFQQADGSTQRRFGGTGLGLSISKHFVEMHGGRMWLESELGRGSTFYFSLPAEEMALSTQGGSALRWLSPEYEYRTRTRRSKSPAPATPPRFVILEQGNMVQGLLRRYLPGAEVIATRALAQAMQELRHSPAQALIINDPVVGQADSALADVCAALPYGTAAVACWLPGQEEAAAQLGIARYLVKPVLREVLCEALDGLGKRIGTVLVVDDEPEVLQLMVRLLASTGRGYRVLRAQDGERALELLRERKPDVMLLDLRMPQMDGYQVLREKGQDSTICDIPVFILSAQDPSGGPAIGNSFALTRGGGLSGRDLITCLSIWGKARALPAPTDDPEPPATPAG